MNLTNSLKAGLAGLVAATAIGANAEVSTNALEAVRQESKPLIENAYANSTFRQKYVGILGFTFSEGAVQQSDIGFDVKGMSFNAWSNFDFKQQKLNEIDLSLSKRFDTPHLAIAPGFIWYTFPGTDFNDAYVPTLGLYSKKLPVDLRFNFYQAFGEGSGDGQFYQFGVGKTIPLFKRVSLGVEGRLNYNDHFFSDGAGFQSVAADAAINVDLGKGYTLSPNIRAQKSIEDNFGGKFKDEAIFGIRLGKKF